MDFNIYSDSQLKAFSLSHMQLKTAAEFRATSSSSMHHRSGSTMYFTGGDKIHLNGPAARQAEIADQCDCQLAFWTNRVPQHEPWSRAVMKEPEKNITHDTLEFDYKSKEINKKDGGDDLSRGRYWRR